MKISFGTSFILLYISTYVAIACSLQHHNIFSSRNVNCSAYCGPEICSSKCSNKTKVIYIQGFVPVANDVFNTESVIPAVWVATEDINGDCEILPDYMLQIELVNTECDPSVSSYHAMESAEDRQRKYAVYLGGGCSLATEPLAVISGNFYKIPIVSYGASSPSLSNREQFPNFYRTIPSEIQANSARFGLMRKYNWTKVAALYETVPLFSLAAEDFDRQYTKIYGKQGNLLLLSFSDSPAVPLQRIKDDDVRIIMVYFYVDKAIATLCQAYRLKLTTPKHVWVWPAWYERDWYNTDYPINATGSDIMCNKEQMRAAVKYSLFLDSYNKSTATTDTGNTRTTEDFVRKLNCYLEEFRNNPSTSDLHTEKTEAHLYSGFGYDAVWMIAYALDKTQRELAESGSGLTLEDIEYFEANNVSKIIGRHLAQTNFSGVSGPVHLDENGTRTGLTGIYQLRENPNNENELTQLLIAVHYPGLRGEDNLFNYDFTYIPGLDPKWKENNRNAPRDRKSPLSVSLNTILVYGTYISATVAFIIDVLLLVFNLAALRKPLIHNSAPHVNNVIIIGCGVMIAGSLLLGMDSSNTELFAALCILRLWVLAVGFTLSFGALFAKTWLVYSVYSNVEMKNKRFKMRGFVLIIMIFLAIDLVYLSFWTGKYPFYKELVTIENPNQDQEKQYEICYCDNFGYLIGALFVYKGCVVICGLFLAYESRNVKYFYINDSRFVSITMYIVVILVGIGAPLSLVLADNRLIDVAFALAAFTIIVACMSCLLILFIPKFYYMANPTKLEKSLDDPMAEVDVNKSIGLQLTEVQTCKPKEQNSSMLNTTSENINEGLHQRGQACAALNKKSDSL